MDYRSGTEYDFPSTEAQLFIGAKCGIDRTRFHWLAGRNRGGAMRFLVLYCDFSKIAATAHIWAPRAITWRAVEMSFFYAFHVLNLEKLIGEIDSASESVLDMAIRLGYNEIGRIKNWYGASDKVIVEIYKDQAGKWMYK